MDEHRAPDRDAGETRVPAAARSARAALTEEPEGALGRGRARKGRGETRAARRIERLRRRETTCQVPQPVPNEPGLVTVDATWGTIAPMRIAPGVATVGELEVIEQIAAGLPLIDTRLEHFYRAGTIPGARSIPHEEITEAIDSLDAAEATVFFCNGPQCAATPDAIRSLLASGYPPGAILYYRGGMHDWMTLGLPVEAPRSGGGG